MIRVVGETVIAFDCEWIPDVGAAQLLFSDAEMERDEVLLEKLFAYNGATPEVPQPFVRLMQSRVVSIAMVRRIAPKAAGEDPKIDLIWLPKVPEDASKRSERHVVGSFLAAVGRSQPQLVGFNSRSSDLRILAQRALALGIPARGFLHRPAKPWEGIDYFAKDGDASIDLMEVIAGNFTGKGALVNLHEAATLCGIPGKFDTHGDAVLEMWKAGKYREIVQYNCYDAITTYLLWLRVAFVSGHFTADEYAREQDLLREYLMGLCENPSLTFLEAYIEEWDRLVAIKEMQQAAE